MTRDHQQNPNPNVTAALIVDESAATECCHARVRNQASTYGIVTRSRMRPETGLGC
jgi:hypothetical protein